MIHQEATILLKACCKKTCSGNSEDGDLAHSDLLYSVDDVPPWYLTLILGFQVNEYLYMNPLISHCLNVILLINFLRFHIW